MRGNRSVEVRPGRSDPMKTTWMERRAHSARLMILAAAAPWVLGFALWGLLR